MEESNAKGGKVESCSRVKDAEGGYNGKEEGRRKDDEMKLVLIYVC